MSKFHKGEIALLIMLPSLNIEPFFGRYIGGDVEIILCMGVGFHHQCYQGMIYYHVKAPDGYSFYTTEKNLVKKKPPEYDGYEKTSWSKCDWQPKEITI